MSFDSITRPLPQTVFLKTAEPRSGRIKFRWLLSAWLVLSMIWIGGVGYDIYHRVKLQADMAQEVERELDQGFVAASCVGPHCASPSAIENTQSLSGIARTYMRFGGKDMMECAFGPPIVLLLLGSSAMFMARRIRRPS